MLNLNSQQTKSIDFLIKNRKKNMTGLSTPNWNKQEKKARFCWKTQEESSLAKQARQRRSVNYSSQEK